MNYPYLNAMRDKVAAMMYNDAVEHMNFENDILASYYGIHNPYLDKLAISQDYVAKRLLSTAYDYGNPYVLNRILSNPAKYKNLQKVLPSVPELVSAMPEYNLLQSTAGLLTKPRSFLSKLGIGNIVPNWQRKQAAEAADFVLSGYGKHLPPRDRYNEALRLGGAFKQTFDDNPTRSFFKGYSPLDVTLGANLLYKGEKLKSAFIRNRAKNILNQPGMFTTPDTSSVGSLFPKIRTFI